MEIQNKEMFSKGRIMPLMVRFTIPAVLSLLIQSIYNIADQIFIGHGVGLEANAVTNLAYPIVLLITALSAWFGDGAAAHFSLCLGRKQDDRAASTVLTASSLSALSGLLILCVGLLFVGPIMRFFGATQQLAEMSEIYFRITFAGIPFVMLGTVLSGLIRADGNPRYAMICMVAGCVVDLILDPIFIFVLHWGVAGAAWSNLIGQVLTCLLAVAYLGRFKLVQLKGRNFFSWMEFSAFIRIGVASFIAQLASAVYMTFINKMIVVYGQQSQYGAEIPLAVFGIMLKVCSIATSFSNGVAIGMQPILGYNYGEENYLRVKECLRSAVLIVSFFACFFFAIFQLFPLQIVQLFGEIDALHQSFAIDCFRTYMFAMPIFGFSMVSTGMFQATGRTVKSTFMALSRHILYVVPFSILFASWWGLKGLLVAAPVGDVFAFATCMTLFVIEVRRLTKLSKESQSV